jgi:hypothetical protein
MMKSNYVLKIDLPNCPKGRVFKPTFDGKQYFLSMTDNEVIEHKLPDYKFSSDIIENNPTWFEKENESHLKIQLELAKRRKKDAEYEISELKKKLKIK